MSLLKDANHRGALFMVAAMAAFAVEDALFKAATLNVPPALALVIFGATGMVIFAVVARLRGEGAWPTGGISRGLVVRSAFELAGRLFFALALAFAGLAATSAILQAAPLVVTVGAVFVLGERVGWRRWTAIAVGFIGVLLVLRPSGSMIEATALFAILATNGFAGRDLATRVSKPSVTNAQLGTLGFAVIILAGLVVQAVSQPPVAMPAPRDIALLVGAGIAGVLAYSALTAAMRTGDVSAVTPFRYTRLLFAMIIAVTLFGERPDAVMLIGSALIVGSGLFTLSRSRPKSG
ncbi:DMT family transporter [Pararhodobacter oceanensis]|uniref:DMT family transporter n=1 Tax=Pararhodobacter oceanensis TaxID=2172121 RepID=UPI003A9099DE